MFKVFPFFFFFICVPHKNKNFLTTNNRKFKLLNACFSYFLILMYISWGNSSNYMFFLEQHRNKTKKKNDAIYLKSFTVKSCSEWNKFITEETHKHIQTFLITKVPNDAVFSFSTHKVLLLEWVFFRGKHFNFFTSAQHNPEVLILLGSHVCKC